MKYITWGADKQRNEIVIASGHDADIVSGGRSEKTQNLDIAGAGLGQCAAVSRTCGDRFSRSR